MKHNDTRKESITRHGSGNPEKKTQMEITTEIKACKNLSSSKCERHDYLYLQAGRGCFLCTSACKCPLVEHNPWCFAALEAWGFSCTTRMEHAWPGSLLYPTNINIIYWLNSPLWLRQPFKQVSKTSKVKEKFLSKISNRPLKITNIYLWSNSEFSNFRYQKRTTILENS